MPDPSYIPISLSDLRRRCRHWMEMVAFRGRSLVVRRYRQPMALISPAPDASDPIQGTLLRAGEMQAADAAATAPPVNSDQKPAENPAKTTKRPIPAARRCPKRVGKS